MRLQFSEPEEDSSQTLQTENQAVRLTGCPTYLLASAGGLVAMYIMHCLTVKFCTVFRWTLAARWHRPVVALAIIEMMIDVPVEMSRPMVPGSRTDENTAREPLRAIVAIWSAAIRGALIVPVRTNRRHSNVDRNLRDRVMNGNHPKTHSNRHKTKLSQCFHRFTFHP
jgi:hypothetical protein